MKKTLFLMVAAFSAVVSLQAQLITWSVKPGVYSKIEPCWDDMYFVYNGNSIGVITGDGHVIVSPEASRITGFYDGYALVLKSSGDRERILGILSDNGTYRNVTDTYYAISTQEFFSEGYATVTNPQGKVGYMDTNGIVDPKHQFDVAVATPFTEGFATIGDFGSVQEFKIINKSFNPLQIRTGSNYPIYGGSGVYKGEAIVWDAEGTSFCYNVMNGTYTKYKNKDVITKEKINSYQFEWDYLGCFSKITRRPGTIPYEKPKRSTETLSATEQGGKYGYAKGGKTILPCQFEQAEAFHGNYAIVKSSVKPALLVLRNTDEAFSVSAANTEIKYQKSKATDLTHKFGLSIPSLWNVQDVIAKIKDENGTNIPTSNNVGVCEFKSDGAGDKETRNFKVELESDGLKLWSGDIAYSYKVTSVPKPDGYLTVTLEMDKKQADKDNRCYVKAIVSNPNSEAISATVYIKGSNLLEEISKRITVPAHGKEVVTTYFTVTKAVSGQKVTVTTSAGGKAELDGLQLIPF